MGLTRIRAEQISDIDYKQAVRVITTSDITLSGGAPATVDGVSLVTGDRVLVSANDPGSENGIYEVQTVGAGSSGTWVRANDGNATGELQAGLIIMVTEGDVYKDTQWKLTTNNPIIIGTTALVFEQNSAFAFGNIYANSTAVLATSVGDSVTFTAGDNISIFGNNTSKTVTIGVTGISLNSISNGTSNVNVVSSGGNVSIGVGGTSNVAVFATTGEYVTGVISATGNVTGSNLNTGAQVIATGNITGGNINTTGVVRATGDLFGKELWSTQSSGDEGGQVNLGIPATNTSLIGQVTIDIFQNKLRFFQGNNAKGAFIDLTAAADGVGTNLLAGGGGGTPGGANTNVQFNDAGVFGGNANFTYDKVLNTVTAGTFAGTLNGSGQNFKVGDDAWIGDINIADTVGIKGQQNGANAYIVFGNSDATGKLGRAGTGPLTYAGAFSATGNITAGNISAGTGTITGGNIVNSNANGVGNIGSSTAYFNTVFAKAASAQYADVAEKYVADVLYPPGTVLEIGGLAEVTATVDYASTRIAGVVSTNPALIMNSGEKSDTAVEVALLGRIPCRVVGKINRGDLLCSSRLRGVATKLHDNLYKPGSIIGKSLQDFDSDTEGTIEILVGRL